MTYYLERDLCDGHRDVTPFGAMDREEAITFAARMHDARMAATAAVLWDHAHRAVCTFGPSGTPGTTEIKCKEIIKMKKNHYYGDLFDDLDDEQ